MVSAVALVKLTCINLLQYTDLFNKEHVKVTKIQVIFILKGIDVISITGIANTWVLKAKSFNSYLSIHIGKNWLLEGKIFEHKSQLKGTLCM